VVEPVNFSNERFAGRCTGFTSRALAFPPSCARRTGCSRSHTRHSLVKGVCSLTRRRVALDVAFIEPRLRSDVLAKQWVRSGTTTALAVL
jgi:hypothetical protein